MTNIVDIEPAGPPHERESRHAFCQSLWRLLRDEHGQTACESCRERASHSLQGLRSERDHH